MALETEFALLRTAQEALANVAKHAHATRVGVTLSYLEHEVALDVRDDGRGFDPASLEAGTAGNGVSQPPSGGGGFGGIGLGPGGGTGLGGIGSGGKTMVVLLCRLNVGPCHSVRPCPAVSAEMPHKQGGLGGYSLPTSALICSGGGSTASR